MARLVQGCLWLPLCSFLIWVRDPRRELLYVACFALLLCCCIWPAVKLPQSCCSHCLSNCCILHILHVKPCNNICIQRCLYESTALKAAAEHSSRIQLDSTMIHASSCHLLSCLISSCLCYCLDKPFGSHRTFVDRQA